MRSQWEHDNHNSRQIHGKTAFIFRPVGIFSFCHLGEVDSPTRKSTAYHQEEIARSKKQAPIVKT